MARRHRQLIASGAAAIGTGGKLINDYYGVVRKNVKARINANTRSWNAVKYEAPNATRTSNPTTYQHDTRTTYRRRRAPRRVRRAARKSFARFSKHMSTLLGCKRLVQNSFTAVTASAGTQNVMALSYFTALQMSDAYKLFGTDVPEGPVATGQTELLQGTSAASELLFRNFRIETEIKNMSDHLAFVDLYYWYPRKDCLYDVGSYLQNEMSLGTGNNANNAGTFPASGVPLTFQNELSTSILGMTPFDTPAFTENFVIYRTRRVMLQGGQSFSIDMKLKPGNQSTKDWMGCRLRRNISRGVLVFVQGEVNGGSTQGITLNAHTQTWATIYKQGGKGPVSQTFVGTGLP